MRHERNKLYVWKDVMADYTSGIAFALAPDLKTARELVIKDGAHADEINSAEPQVIKISDTYAAHVWGGG